MNQHKEILANVHSIETFGAFDGPGVRYVMFLQGCPFKCAFCHNRDTWSTRKNQLMSVDDIINNYKRYKNFYKEGGITVSGGEPLLQTKFLIKLFKRCKEEAIHTAIDTSAACYDVKKSDDFHELMKYTDLVLLDIKHIDDNEHKKLVGSTNKQVLAFAKYLSEIDKDVNLRHVLIPTITAKKDALKGLRSFIDTLTNIVKIDVLPYHTKGKTKWEEMGLIYPLGDLREPNLEEINEAEEILKLNYQYKKYNNKD